MRSDPSWKRVDRLHKQIFALINAASQADSALSLGEIVTALGMVSSEYLVDFEPAIRGEAVAGWLATVAMAVKECDGEAAPQAGLSRKDH